MEILTKILSVCKSEFVTYQQLKELKKVLNLKTKYIAGVLANNNFKFTLNEPDIFPKPMIDEERVVLYIDNKIKEIINKLANIDKNNSIKYIEYSEQLIETCKDRNKLKDNFEIICSKYIPLHVRIVLATAYNGIDYPNVTSMVKVNKIKPVFVVMAIANSKSGPTQFKITHSS